MRLGDGAATSLFPSGRRTRWPAAWAGFGREQRGGDSRGRLRAGLKGRGEEWGWEVRAPPHVAARARLAPAPPAGGRANCRGRPALPVPRAPEPRALWRAPR